MNDNMINDKKIVITAYKTNNKKLRNIIIVAMCAVVMIMVVTLAIVIGKGHLKGNKSNSDGGLVTETKKDDMEQIKGQTDVNEKKEIEKEKSKLSEPTEEVTLKPEPTPEPTPEPDENIKVAKAYKDYLMSGEVEEKFGDYPDTLKFQFVHIDDDNIIEMVCSKGNYHWYGGELYKYQNDTVVDVGHFGTGGVFMYEPYKNNIYHYASATYIEMYLFYHIKDASAENYLEFSHAVHQGEGDNKEVAKKDGNNISIDEFNLLYKRYIEDVDWKDAGYENGFEFNNENMERITEDYTQFIIDSTDDLTDFHSSINGESESKFDVGKYIDMDEYSEIKDILCMQVEDHEFFGSDNSFNIDGYRLMYAENGCASMNNDNKNITVYGISIGDSYNMAYEKIKSDGWILNENTSERYNDFYKKINDKVLLISFTLNAKDEITSWFFTNWPEGEDVADFIAEQG